MFQLIVTSHYPIFLSTTKFDNAASALGWASEEGEKCTDGVCDGTEFMSCDAAGESPGTKKPFFSPFLMMKKRSFQKAF